MQMMTKLKVLSDGGGRFAGLRRIGVRGSDHGGLRPRESSARRRPYSRTAMPGGLGTTGLAGHRDSFFRPLRRVERRMQIMLSDKTGTYRYTIDSTEIVTPDRVQVLDVRAQPELTLVICYPFDYVGHAPKRFIVHAHLLSAAPERFAMP